ncbi:glycosyltransferase family 2 protein [Pseudomonas juntendi]|uniref:glycosyltransferase family 2 protein n=1 Tax=Pseudomonas juntendi TaxID=2666183 RepID=UPI002FCD73BC
MQKTNNLKVACCAIMKNESPYIHEWVAHYKNLGFDHIAIYENDSNDRTAHLLKTLASNGHIEFKSWPSLDKKSPQISAYEDFISRTDCDWVLFCDADEFLVLKNHDNVHDFLSGFPEEVSEVCVNWRVFGSSGHEKRTAGLVIDRFRKCSYDDFQVNRHVKSFVRPSSVIDMHIHAPVVSGMSAYCDGERLEFRQGEQGISPEIRLDVAVINHYFTRSKEEWMVKKLRGNANRAINARDKFVRYHEGLFDKHDRNEVDNIDALKYMPRITEFVSIYLSELGK